MAKFFYIEAMEEHKNMWTRSKAVQSIWQGRIAEWTHWLRSVTPMHPRKETRRVKVAACLVTAGVVCGCSMPLHVDRVADPIEPVAGVRFLVKRPSYEATLLLDESKGSCQFRLFVTQALDAEPLEYEATGEVRVFSNTDLELTQDASGHLQSVSAGEEDQLHEAFLAIAEVAVSLASPVKQTQGEAPACTPPSPDEGRLARYVAAHRALQGQLGRVANAREERLNNVGPRTGSGTLRVIDALEERAETLAEEVADHRYRLKSDQVAFDVDGRRFGAPAGGQDVWFTVRLEQGEDR